MSDLKREFTFIMYLYVSVLFFCAFAGFFIITHDRSKAEFESDFRHQLDLMVKDVEFQVINANENVRALGSRSMIKKALYDLHRGESSLEEVRKFTVGKYVDGAKVFDNLLYCERSDAKGRVVAFYGEVTPGGERESSTRPLFFTYNNRTAVLVRVPIVQSGEVIGYEEAAFYMTSLESDSYPILRDLRIVSWSAEKSVSIANTGFYLSAAMDPDILKERMSDSLAAILVRTFLLLLALAALTYWFIYRFVLRLIRALEEYRASFVQQERLALGGQLAAGMAHVFNNLLMAIRGNLELLQLQRNNDEETGYLRNIEKSTAHAAELIQSITDYGRQNYQLKEILELNSFLPRNENQLKSFLPENIGLSFDTGCNETTVYCDPKQLMRILELLLVNAAEAMPDGGNVTISLSRMKEGGSSSCLLCGLSMEGTWIVMEVRDTGPGIPEEMHQKVFDPFYSGNPGKKIGMGLAQVKGIMAQHEGHIALVSKEGEGACFRLYFPPA